jgi:DNA polymerase-3 subunit alpha (Gram-positive type)
MGKDAPLEGQALEQFIAFCGQGAVLVAHNAAFDCGFIQAGIRRCELEFHFSSIDTVPICRSLYPEMKNHKLNTVASFAGWGIQPSPRNGRCPGPFPHLCEDS